MGIIEDLLIKFRSQVQNGVGNEKYEKVVFQSFRNAGYEVRTNEDLSQENFWKSNELRPGEAIDGMINIHNSWIPVQIKYTQNKKLEGIKGNFYECLPTILKAVGSSYGMVISNAKYTSKNLNTFVFSGRELIQFLKKYIQSFSNIIPEINKRTLRPNQIEIIEIIQNHFLISDRGTVILPCGYGKTIISIGAVEKCLDQKTIKVLVLVPNNYLLNQIQENWNEKYELDTYKFNGETSLDQLLNWLNGRQRYIVISTYQSCSNLENIKFNLAIFDECHRTTGRSSENFAYLITRGNIEKRLFLTATPRIVESDKEVISMNDQNLYGPFSIDKGIKQGIDELVLSPYEVLCLIQEPNISYESLIVNMLEQAIIGGYSRKILLFAHKHEELSEIERVYKELFSDRKILRATDGMKRKEQKYLAKQFVSETGPVILLNCNVFVEGFDVAGCDTVTFYKGTKSVVRIIQGLGRALRLDSTNADKIARILLPIVLSPEELSGQVKAEVTDITDVLKAIHQSDDSVVERVKVISLPKVGKWNRTIREKIIEIPESVRTEITLRIIDSVRPLEYTTLKKEVSKAKLRNADEYHRIKLERFWVDDPAKKFKNQGFTCPDFLGHKKEDFWSFEKTKKEFQKYFRKERELLRAWNKMREVEPMVPWYFEEIYGKNITILEPERLLV